MDRKRNITGWDVLAEFGKDLVLVLHDHPGSAPQASEAAFCASLGTSIVSRTLGWVS